MDQEAHIKKLLYIQQVTEAFLTDLQQMFREHLQTTAATCFMDTPVQ